MNSLQIKALVILGVFLATLYFLYPTVRWYTYSPAERENLEKSRDKILTKKISLGLDLQGGMHLLLELERNKIAENELADSMDRAIEIIRNRVDQFGVSEPIIAKQGEQWIVVEIPGVKNPVRAKELIGKTALLEFRLLGPTDKIAPISEKIRQIGISIPEAMENKEILALVPTGHVLLSGRGEDSLYLVKSTPEITGAFLTNARMKVGGEFGMPYVSLDFNPDGAKIFSRVTALNIDKNLAIVLDDVVQSAPVIRSKIPDGKAIIEGNFTEDEAKFLSTILRAGALPAPVRVIEERSVGPTLGEDSIRKGTLASLVGLAAVFLFVMVYYNVSGIVTCVALVFNLVTLLSALALFRFTLTMPGLAGMVLSIAMAVDANVLILERVRDELEAGKTSRVSVDLGYARALSAIIDSNLTTLIAAVFLFQFGTGPIKGFAVTLTLGIIISMFTAIFLTKTIYEYMFREHLLEKVKL